MYGGPSPLCLTPLPGVANPVLTAADVLDADARFVADPFMLQHDGRWYMFFEVMERNTKLGAIAYAESEDGTKWRYRRVVIRENCHLSYPFVFSGGDEIYIIPETQSAGQVRLYRATNFPEQWNLERVILNGEFLDPTIVQHEEHWYLFATSSNEGSWELRLFVSQEPNATWLEHPCSPVRNFPNRLCRMAGRPAIDEGRLILFCQDARTRYGHAALAYEVLELTPSTYRERLLQERVIGATGSGWNSHGMHNLDPHEIKPGNWLACVDGLVRTRKLLQL